MYLTRVNKISGLVMVEDDLDGFYAIPEFRLLLSKGDVGLQMFTVVALVVDYESPIRNYSEKERPNKAMDVVFNSRKEMLWHSPEIQEAAVAYKNLQFNLDIEEKNTLDGMRRAKLLEIQAEEDPDLKVTKSGQLRRINELIESFSKKNEGKDIYADGPVRNGYKLSRLEILVENQKSFYHVEKTSNEE